FLGDQRFPWGKVWAARTLFWLLVALGMSLLVAAGAVAHEAIAVAHYVGHQSQHPPTTLDRSVATAEGSWGRSDLLVYAGLWLLTAFALGQFFAQSWRKSVVSVTLALMVSLGVTCTWLPSLLAGGLRSWQVFVPAAILLLAVWLAFRAWTAQRLLA